MKKYLDKGDKKELELRQQQINLQTLIVASLENAKQTWVVSKFSKYGLDSSKQWTVNPKNGQIKEQKNEPTSQKNPKQ